MTRIEASEVFSPAYMAEQGIDPQHAVRIPSEECCGRLPWNCECERSCVGCREMQRGPGLCGHCHGE